MPVKKHWLHPDNTCSIFFVYSLWCCHLLFSVSVTKGPTAEADTTNHTPTKHVLYKTHPLPLSDLGSTSGLISNVPPIDWSPESSPTLLTLLPECVSDRACRAQKGANINGAALCDVSCHLDNTKEMFCSTLLFLCGPFRNSAACIAHIQKEILARLLADSLLTMSIEILLLCVQMFNFFRSKGREEKIILCNKFTDFCGMKK